MVLKQIKQIKKAQEDDFGEDEEPEEEQESSLEEEERQIKQRLNKLSNPRPQLKKVILKVINKENIPYQRLDKVDGENGEVYEVITIEEALTEILSILRESA